MRRAVTAVAIAAVVAAVAVAWACPVSARTEDVDDVISDLDDIASGFEADLSDIDAVRLQDGTEVPFDATVLDSASSPADTAAQLADALAALDDGAADDVEPERARSTARQVVDELDLDREEDPPPEPPNMPNMSPFASLGQILGYVVLAAALVGIGFAIAAMVRSMSKRVKDEEEEASEVATSGGTLGDEESIDSYTADEWTRRAAASEAEGRYGDAVRYLHYAGLLRLDEDGTVPFDSSRTNGGYLDAAVMLSAGAATEMVVLNRMMEDATYGHLPAEVGDVGHTRSGWEQVRAGLKSAVLSRSGEQ